MRLMSASVQVVLRSPPTATVTVLTRFATGAMGAVAVMVEISALSLLLLFPSSSSLSPSIILVGVLELWLLVLASSTAVS